MDEHRPPEVAILLATHNGARFIEPQIQSLTENSTPFTLHWLDDQSTDGTRDAVHAAAARYGVTLKEWHQPQRQGFPGAFYQLMESVEADLYLFCDQDDLWQPGKIDAAVADLLPELANPVLCFSDPFIFFNDNPTGMRRISETVGVNTAVALQESRAFMPILAPGHSQGFTRPLRDLVMKHQAIARAYSVGHDSWLYLIAVAAGAAHMLYDTPTSMWRRHGGNFTEATFTPTGNKLAWTWRAQRSLRQIMARQAEGFILASPTLPPGPKVERLLGIARLLAKLNRRQSLPELVQLARRGAMLPSARRAMWLAASCLCSDAAP